MRFCLCLFVFLALFGCSSKKNIGQADSPIVLNDKRTVGGSLEQNEAMARKLMVSNLKYGVWIHLKPEADHYNGTLEAKFDYTPHERPLTLDFLQGKILSLSVNGIKIITPNYNNYFITIERQWLKTGENTILVDFEKPYSTNGSGFYKFTDPLDQKIYMYTDFEPYNANNFIPCFDQPDLKATYILSVSAPNDFKVISAAKEAERTTQGETTLWKFRETKTFSTYIFPLHAGPYHEWSERYNKIPLKLFVRQSLKAHVDYKFWFTITKQGFKYFETYFNYPYPFEKYDQVIVPDFNSGAMENVGAVTFAERYIRRGKKTLEEEERLANVILHEMSHMWFGNLVTMEWWNGLWLNESFASFMAVKGLQDATSFKKAWMTFFDDDKNWAYFEDDLSTTHPIEGVVANTDEAFNNFDGITYGKGASVLKQLNFFLGDEAFKKGMQAYFKQYQYQNTKIEDFLGALENSSGKKLNLWSDLWLKTTGFDRVAAVVNCGNGKVQDFFIEEQVAGRTENNRFHATKVGFYYLDKKLKLSMKKQFDVTYQLKSKVDEANGAPCPDLVWLNQDDYDYVRVVLDEKSLFTIKNHLSSIVDPLTRSGLWSTLWDMVRESKMKVKDYLTVVKKHLPKEPEFKIKLKVLETLPDSLFYLKDKGEETKWFEDFMEKGFKQARNTDEKKLFYDQLLRLGKSVDVQKFWLKCLGDKDAMFDQDRRWETIIALSRSGHVDYETLITIEANKDQSEKGKKNALAAQVVFPKKEIKSKWLEAIFQKNNTYSLAEKKTVLRYLFPQQQTNLRETFFHRLYDFMPEVLKTEENEFIEAYGHRLAPLTCEPYPYVNLVSYMDKTTSLGPVLKKSLQMNLDEDKRCLDIRQFNL